MICSASYVTCTSLWIKARDKRVNANANSDLHKNGLNKLEIAIIFSFISLNFYPINGAMVNKNKLIQNITKPNACFSAKH